MATLARIYDFTRQKFQRKHPNEEFENIRTFLDAFRVHNPLLGDLDFGGFRADAFGARFIWDVVDASKFSYLQHAVDAIEHGVVLIPPGTYSIGAEPLLIDRDDIYLVGLGRVVIKKERIYLPRSADSYLSSARGNPAIWIKKAARCGLVNLTVDMSDTQGVDVDPFPTAAVQANNCPDVRIHGVNVVNFGDRQYQAEPRGTATAAFAAIDVRNSDRAQVIECGLDRIRAAGIWCGGLLDYQGEAKGKQLIFANRIRRADVGVQIVPTNNVQVVWNQFVRISGSGVSIIDDSTSLNVRSADLVVSGNQFSTVGINPDTDIAAIDFRVTNPRYHNISICGNQIEHVRGTPETLGMGIRLNPLESIAFGSSGGLERLGLTNVKIEGNSLIDIYDHGIEVEYVMGIEPEFSAVKSLSISDNIVTDASIGPEKRRAISIFGVAYFTDGTRAFNQIRVCGNIISGGDLEYGILVYNSGDSPTSPDVGDALSQTAEGRGGIIEGNIISAGADKAQIRVIGDQTITVGENVADTVQFANVIDTLEQVNKGGF